METKGEDLGHIKNVQCDITSPMTAKWDIALRELNILTGLNGSGKSLILKLNWVFGTIASTLVLNKEAMLTSEIEQMAQFVLDKTFDSQDFHGTIGATFEKASIKIVLDKGQVTSLEYVTDCLIDKASPPVFMSTTLRTFSQIDQYLKVEAMVKTMEGMLELYKLYDVAFIARMKQRLEGGLKVSEEVKDTLKNNFDLKIDLETIGIENNSVVYTDSKGKISNLAMLSNGEQSLINMVLANG